MTACCVPNCSSKQTCSVFPKNVECQERWFRSLGIRPLEDKEEIIKLRICHKHFPGHDYNNWPNRSNISINPSLSHTYNTSQNKLMVSASSTLSTSNHCNITQQTTADIDMQDPLNTLILYDEELKHNEDTEREGLTSRARVFYTKLRKLRMQHRRYKRLNRCRHTNEKLIKTLDMIKDLNICSNRDNS